MKRKLGIGAALASAVVIVAWSIGTTDARAGGRGDGPIVYVRGQELYFDSIIVADPLPANGPFQLLEMGPHGLETDYGPGDVGYKGGRWVEDFDGDGELHYFLCPLLPPGREEP